MRLSSIDIGSNAIRQIIVAVDGHNQWEVLKKERFPIRLGHDVFNSRRIEATTLALMIHAFKEFARNNKKYRVQKTRAVATSAMRDAINSAEIIKKIEQTSQIKIEVIRGSEEAELIQRAIFKTHIMSSPKTVLLDIGGGSAEYTFMEASFNYEQNFKRVWAASFPLGVVRLMKMMEKSKTKIPALASNYLNRIPRKVAKSTWPLMIGTGGNFDALAKLKMQLLGKAVQTNLTYDEVLAIKNKWSKLSFEKKIALDIRKDRIDVLEYAIDLILHSMRLLGSKKIKIPFVGLKEGVIHCLQE